MAISEALGEEREVDLPGGRIRYRERGEGPPVVFVHGIFVSADLWRKVVPGVAAAGFRCIAPDWPLGSHQLAMPDADLSPTGVATLIAGFLDALGLDDVTLVANDTGGALTQLLITSRPERVGRVVLTSCDSFERFFPPILSFLPVVARSRLATWFLIQNMRPRFAQRLPISFGWTSKRTIDQKIMDNNLRPTRTDPAIRADVRRFLRQVDKQLTLDAAARLPQFDKPVLLAWATQDRFFPVELAHRLEALLPQATFTGIDDSYTFVPEDQPDVLTDLIVTFARSHAQT